MDNIRETIKKEIDNIQDNKILEQIKAFIMWMLVQKEIDKSTDRDLNSTIIRKKEDSEITEECNQNKKQWFIGGRIWRE